MLAIGQWGKLDDHIVGEIKINTSKDNIGVEIVLGLKSHLLLRVIHMLLYSSNFTQGLNNHILESTKVPSG